MSGTGDWERALEPKKFDPSHVREISVEDELEDILHRYKSVTGKNPYTSKPSFRDGLKDRECYLPQQAEYHHPQQAGYHLSHQAEYHLPQQAECYPPQQTYPAKNNASGCFKNPQVWVLPSPPTAPHPGLRNQPKTESTLGGQTKQVLFDLYHQHYIQSPGRKRTTSQPLSPSPYVTAQQSPARTRYAVQKSHSDTHFPLPRSDSPQKERKFTPKPLIIPSNPFSQEKLTAIREQESYAMNYKVQVRKNPESDEKIIRSPLKRLFGEGGILGRSTTGKDMPDPRYKKTGLAVWGEKVKQRVEDLGKDFSKLSFESHGSSAATGKMSTFPVTLSPYAQAELYMQLELVLNIETNKFLMNEFQNNRLSVSSVKFIVETWAKKGRPQVLGFRYDVLTQRDLVHMNSDTLHFAGVNAFNRSKAQSVLACWKVLAKEISLHTFCQPDSAVKKHLHDAEKVLELVDASTSSMLAFQEMRVRVYSDLYQKEKQEIEKKFLNGVERSVFQGSPGK